MREIWLYPNRRAILFGCVPTLILAVNGGLLSLYSNERGEHPWRWVGVAALLIGLGMLGILIRQLRRPRVAFDNGLVLFYLRNGSPIGVPVDIVESFFAGQSPAHLPIATKQPQTVNLIARLSQRHKEWAEQTVKPALGKWSEGYVTIRGTWCQPLDTEVIRRLNRRLKEVKDDSSRTTNHD